MQIFQANYELQQQAAQASHSANTILHGSTSGTSAFITSSAKTWLLDSESSLHMTGINNKFHSLFFSNIIPHVNIVDGSASSTVCGK